MKVAAGVILIVAAVLNLVAGFLYLAGGGAATAGGHMLENAVKSGDVENVAVAVQKTADDEAKNMTASDAAKDVKFTGGKLMAFGVFLLVACGIMIAGAVCLFRNKAAGFILVAAVIAILAELLGIYATKFGVTNLPGIVGGVLAIIAGLSVKKTQAQAA